MKFSIFILLNIMWCIPTQERWTLIANSEEPIAFSTGYIDEKGNTVIPIGKYVMCYTEEFDKIAIVLPRDSESFVAINKEEEVLFEVLAMDNAPDEVRNGLFRIRINNKEGFANMQGDIVIKPIFDAVLPFEGGKAAVNIGCTKVEQNGHSTIKGGKWGLIDTKGVFLIQPTYKSLVELLEKIRKKQ